jgi:hypothetical protein
MAVAEMAVARIIAINTDFLFIVANPLPIYINLLGSSLVRKPYAHYFLPKGNLAPC